MIGRFPVENDIPRRDVDFLESAHDDIAGLPLHPQIAKVEHLRPIRARQRGLPAVQDVELVHVERVKVVGDGDDGLVLVGPAEDQPGAFLRPVVVRMLHDERQMHVFVDVVSDFEVEDVAVVEEACAGPDEGLHLAQLSRLVSREKNRMNIYPLGIINMRSNLTRRPLLGRRLRVDDRIRRDKPVAGADFVFVVDLDVELGRFDFRTLSKVD